MMETQRYTAVVRSTRSNNYYQLPVSPTASVASSDMSEHFMSSASTWATSSMRSITSQNVDLNSSFLNSSQSSNTSTPQFQPAFAFDVNQLVNSLRRSTSANALNSSQRSTTTSSVSSSSPGRRENSTASLPRVDSRIQILPVEPVVNRRGRRGAMAGDGEFSRTRLPEQNSIINYKHMKRMAPPPSVRQKMHDQMQKSKLSPQQQPQPEPSPPREFVIVKQDFPLAKKQQPEIAAVPMKLQQQQQQFHVAAVPDEPNPHDDRDSLYGDSYTF